MFCRAIGFQRRLGTADVKANSTACARCWDRIAAGTLTSPRPLSSHQGNEEPCLPLPALCEVMRTCWAYQELHATLILHEQMFLPCTLQNEDHWNKKKAANSYLALVPKKWSFPQPSHRHASDLCTPHITLHARSAAAQFGAAAVSLTGACESQTSGLSSPKGRTWGASAQPWHQPAGAAGMISTR